MIEQAIEFVISQVHEPALAHPDLPVEIKNKITNNRTTIKSFSKVGDLYQYIRRFSSAGVETNDSVFNALEEHNLRSLETIIGDYEQGFKYELNDFTVLSDFVFGEIYSSYDIANFAKTYDVRQGIYLVGDEPNYEAIFTKVTLGLEGSYPNEWLKEGVELKHYIKASNNSFSLRNLEWKHNRAFINAAEHNVPIYVFIKSGTECRLEGIFTYVDHETDENGGIWFRLVKSDAFDARLEVTIDAYQETLAKQVQKALQDSSEARQTRLSKAPKKPKKQNQKNLLMSWMELI